MARFFSLKGCAVPNVYQSDLVSFSSHLGTEDAKYPSKIPVVSEDIFGVYKNSNQTETPARWRKIFSEIRGGF
jgi:hypothetical protein